MGETGSSLDISGKIILVLEFGEGLRHVNILWKGSPPECVLIAGTQDLR